MKKLLSLALCIVLICFALVGCAEDIIGEYLSNYNTNAVTDDQIEKLNFYIITGDNTSEEAKITVPQNINAYIKEKHRIVLNIKYYTADEYLDAVNSAIAKTNESERPDIILINSKNMFYDLYNSNKLVKLNDLYSSKDFRSINTVIDSTLLRATTQNTGGDKYVVPNNHVMGVYKYIVIDKSIARDTLHFSNAEIEAMTTEESLTELKAAINTYYDSNPDGNLSKEEFLEKCVKIVSGGYKDKLLLEYGVGDETEITADSLKKNYVNISEYPSATEDEAFLSAFAIVRQLTDTSDTYTEEEQAVLTSHYSKCMKIIYALNTDVQLKNMLQYGYVGTNYRFEKNEKNENTNYVNLIKNPEVIYEMDPIYTGNLFISYYCNEIGWTEKVHNDILRQNADAIIPTEE